MELLKRETEGQNEYISRIYKNKVELGMTNKETMEAINKELGTSYAESTLRSIAYPFNEGFELGYEKALSSSKGGNNELIAEIEEKRMAMEKERIKLQTTKLEYNRNLRIDSRQELLYENIKEAQERIPLPNFQDIPLEYVDGSYVLCWTDLHYGAKFVSENNSYSREECKRRLEYLASKVKNMCVEKGIGNLHICGLSDDIQGLLRITDVKINDIPVVESVVEVSRLLASILSSISEKTNVTYYHTMASNHSQTRPITGKADLIKEDLEVIIGNYIQDLVSDNDRIEVVLSKKRLPFYSNRRSKYPFNARTSN